ncbi:helix-turn-helix domain-containing protein [Microbacterium flavum]|uniref:Cupin domain-containing protein n=1 Tax=Microbacterium flavum TaxID=415216 RepID=A0ABS5XXU5_9MICO|nr:cupin domain-containing protein [Microbacterium flavum]MBT8799377.1 cupin domain-containing protein [Microbacterium flavum]
MSRVSALDPDLDPVDRAAVRVDAAGEGVGERLRALRMARGMSARDLARRLGISPSAVSQIERGVMQPSVSRLIAITDELDVPLTSVFDSAGDEAADAPLSFGLHRAAHAEHDDPIVLENGVTFRRISPIATPGVDYFESTYPPGATAHGGTELFRHEGYEVGTVTSGELTIDFDDERVVLRAGDAISYPCSRPHRLHNTSDEPVIARWLIVHGAR